MLTTEKLEKHSKYLNLYQLCAVSGAKYNTIKGKLRRYRIDSKRGRLTKKEAHLLQNGINHIVKNLQNGSY